MELIPEFVRQAPLYHLLVEGVLVIWILWLLFRKSYSPSEKSKLSEKEKQELINEWTPEPLVPKVNADNSLLKPTIIDGLVERKKNKFHFIITVYIYYSPIAKYAMVDGKKSLNCATNNFLNFIGNGQIEVKFSFYRSKS